MCSIMRGKEIRFGLDVFQFFNGGQTLTWTVDAQNNFLFPLSKHVYIGLEHSEEYNNYQNDKTHFEQPCLQPSI